MTATPVPHASPGRRRTALATTAFALAAAGVLVLPAHSGAVSGLPAGGLHVPDAVRRRPACGSSRLRARSMWSSPA